MIAEKRKKALLLQVNKVPNLTQQNINLAKQRKPQTLNKVKTLMKHNEFRLHKKNDDFIITFFF